MSYKSWFDKHAQKHKIIVDKLSHLSNQEIVAYFSYDNMREKEIDFCPLYAQDKKCHDIDNLNCYLCGCSNFRLDNSKSYCGIDSKDGATIKGKDGFIHQDCSQCIVPHDVEFIHKVFNRDWKLVMKDVM